MDKQIDFKGIIVFGTGVGQDAIKWVLLVWPLPMRASGWQGPRVTALGATSFTVTVMFFFVKQAKSVFSQFESSVLFNTTTQ